LSESLSELDRKVFASPRPSSSQQHELSANFDWTLLVRCQQSITSEQALVQRRQEQILDRIYFNQKIWSLLQKLSCPGGEASKMAAGEGEVVNSDADNCASSNDENARTITELFFSSKPSQAATSDAAVSTETLPSVPTDPYNQRLLSGGDYAFEKIAMAACGNVFLFVNTFMHSLQQMKTGSTSVELDSLSCTVPTIVASIQELRQYLLCPEKFVANNDNVSSERRLLLDPLYVQRLSYYVRTLCAWSTLLLVSAIHCLSNDGMQDANIRSVFTTAITGVASSCSQLSGSFLCVMCKNVVCAGNSYDEFKINDKRMAECLC
jgi:hypothetical protein